MCSFSCGSKGKFLVRAIATIILIEINGLECRCGSEFAYVRNGHTLSAAFEQAACAVFAIITDLDQIKAATKVEIARKAPDEKLLLVDWLNELIYESTIRKMVFG